MKTFDLELRVSTFGSIITWRVMLEDATNDNNRIIDWRPSDDSSYLFKKLPGYQISDNALEVFVGCNGIKGGTVTCEVIINGKPEEKKVISNVTDTNYAKVSYKI
jgi:hypothetical protein